MKQRIVWSPSEQFIEQSNLKRFERWLAETRDLHFETYEQLWEWSIQHIDTFWECMWHYFEVISHHPYKQVLSSQKMPGAHWFEGATLNYAEHIFRNKKEQGPALYFVREGETVQSLGWNELEQQVGNVARFLRESGVKKGDPVAAYIPNVPEAIILFLAVNSIGAVWSCCSPDFGVRTVIDRFSQIEPVCLFAVNGYRYSGKVFSRTKEVQDIAGSIGSIEDTIWIDLLGEGLDEGVTSWTSIQEPTGADSTLTFTPVPFDHPIWVLYSSGTTGTPKAITHSHGGVLLEHLKYLAFHNDVHPGEHFFWFTTTGWMMWNFLQASMLVGGVPVLYDGSPGYPSLDALWELAAALPIHHFGTSAPFLVASMKQELKPGDTHDLSSLRSIGSTGAPLPAEAFDWVYDAVSKEVWLCSMSGGTDVCTAFVGGCPYKPVLRGAIQCRGLGCAMKAYDEDGKSVTDMLGEMVIEKPMPSMPVYFWNDEGGERYKASYFSVYPNVWRHGDWIEIFEHGSLVIQGRSDATLNRKGVRIGTSEIYAIVAGVEGVKDSLVLDLDARDGELMPLFVVVDGDYLSEEQVDEIKHTLRIQGSPRHMPDLVLKVPDIPYTLSGKKMEVPVKKIIMGAAASTVMNKDAVRNPEAFNYFVSISASFRKHYLDLD